MSHDDKAKTKPVSEDQLKAIEAFIAKTGGVEQAKAVLDTLKNLKQAG